MRQKLRLVKRPFRSRPRQCDEVTKTIHVNSCKKLRNRSQKKITCTDIWWDKGGFNHWKNITYFMNDHKKVSYVSLLLRLFLYSYFLKMHGIKPTIHRLAFDVPSVFLVSVFLIEVIKCWRKKPLFQTLLVNVYWKL